MSIKNDLALAYHMGYDDALAKRKPDASKTQVLAPYDLATENPDGVDARYLGLTANKLAKIVTDLKSENAKLKEERDGFEALSNLKDAQFNNVLASVKMLNSENAKLRMFIDLKETCWKHLGWCDECPYNGVDDEHDDCNCTVREKVNSLARELGIDVNG